MTDENERSDGKPVQPSVSLKPKRITVDADLARLERVGLAALALNRSLLPKYEGLLTGVSISLIRSGVLDTLGHLRVSEATALRAVAVNSSVLRLTSGANFMSGYANLQETVQRLRVLTESPGWLRMMEQNRGMLTSLSSVSKASDFLKISSGLQRSFRIALEGSSVIEIERALAVSTRAWDDVLRRASMTPAATDAARLYAFGRGTLGVVSGGALLVEDDAQQKEDSETSLVLSRDGLNEALRRKLTALNMNLAARLDGAWDSVASGGPDAASQAAHSLMELLDWSLRLAAPDDEVLRWHTETRRPAKEVHKGRPTRTLRARFILRERADDQLAVRLHLRAITDVAGVIESAKHRLGNNDLIAIGRLIPTVEGILIFLFVDDV